MNPLYYIIFSAAALTGIGLAILRVRNRKTVPVAIFIEALRNENRGDYEAAIHGYETALAEVNKSRFPKGRLLTRITAKLKVLRTLIRYQSGFQMAHDEWVINK